jgi:hypothetical protein
MKLSAFDKLIWSCLFKANPKVYLTYSQDVLLFTGDFNAFKKEFGTSTEVVSSLRIISVCTSKDLTFVLCSPSVSLGYNRIMSLRNNLLSLLGVFGLEIRNP